MSNYVLRDGTEVTREQIANAYAEGKARLCHGRRDGGTSTGLMLDGIDYDTRGECFSVWDEVWTTRPQTIREALAAAA